MAVKYLDSVTNNDSNGQTPTDTYMCTVMLNNFGRQRVNAY